METKEVNINIIGEGKEIIIRHGEAEVLPERQQFQFFGNIEAPFKFCNGRIVNISEAVAAYSIQKRIIVFTENISEPLTPQINGMIQENENLKKFKINTGEMFALDAFSKLIRLNSTLFESREEALRLSACFSNFKAKVSTILEGNADHRTGSFRKLIEKSVENGLPESFKMKCDIFAGSTVEPSVFNVEVCIDATDTSIRIWLESPELIALFEELSNKLILEQIELFKEKNITCIHSI